jgi:hypothetical protein
MFYLFVDEGIVLKLIKLHRGNGIWKIHVEKSTMRGRCHPVAPIAAAEMGDAVPGGGWVVTSDEFSPPGS